MLQLHIDIYPKELELHCVTMVLEKQCKLPQTFIIITLSRNTRTTGSWRCMLEVNLWRRSSIPIWHYHDAIQNTPRHEVKRRMKQNESANQKLTKHLQNTPKSVTSKRNKTGRNWPNTKQKWLKNQGREERHQTKRVVWSEVTFLKATVKVQDTLSNCRNSN